MRKTVALVVTLMAVTLGACGGSGDPAASSSNGDVVESAGTDAKEAVSFDPCAEISADDVGVVIGAAVTSEVGPFDACEYDQEDPRAVSATIDTQPESELGGGFEAYRSGSKAALTDAVVTDLSGIGQSAFAVTGRFGDGENTQLQAAALVDGVVITVNLTQATGLAAADVLVEQATQLLQVAASKV